MRSMNVFRVRVVAQKVAQKFGSVLVTDLIVESNAMNHMTPHRQSRIARATMQLDRLQARGGQLAEAC